MATCTLCILLYIGIFILSTYFINLYFIFFRKEKTPRINLSVYVL
uniref:Uncharacterized protein n=1 Tax=virus sp. ctE0n6 TaxID=2827985 RepID=A0A8S5RFV6_9VIRU|nr:MAG TPA: hypothetical protein [virus sp. ctE0n6]